MICDFFEDLDKILGSRPASSLAGIDSQEFSQESLKTSHSTASPSTIDADITEDDISNCATQVEAVAGRPGTSQSTSDTTNWDTPFSKKKKRER
jgi:hypothetical protein